jgi:hypothetical protein
MMIKFFKFNFNSGCCLLLFILFLGIKAESQGIGCDQLNFTITLEPGTSCCYKLTATNTAQENCFRTVNLNIGSDIFENFTGLSDFQVNKIEAGEYNIRPAVGFIPKGVNDVASFCVRGGPSSNFVIQWNNLCLSEGCEQIIPLAACAWEGAIQGTVYADIGCAETEYSDQPTLEDWNVSLYNGDDLLIQETVTDEFGYYLFYNLPPGQYYCRATAQPGWSPNVPATGQVQVNLEINEIRTENFGYCRNDCSCDSLLYSVQQVEDNNDTLTYYISLTASQDICYRFLEVAVDSGQLVDFYPISSLICCTENNKSCCHWTGLKKPGEQTIILEHDSGSIPIYNDLILKLRIAGGDVQKLSIRPRIDESDNSGLCDKSYSYSFPTEPLLNCCPNKTFLGPELICNGDFNVTNPSSPGFCFNTNYVYFTGGAVGGNSFTVGNSTAVSSANGSSWGCIGQTGPSDNFMIVDGGPQSYNVWQEKIPVNPSEEYTFSVFMNCIDKIPTTDPKIDVFINLVPVNNLTAPFNAGWQNLTFCWNSGTDSLADITIKTNHNIGYNDFALDNISFKQCIKEDTCICGNFNLWYSIGRGPLLNYKCGDTLLVPSSWSLLPVKFLPEMICKGIKCDTPTVDWILTGPVGSGFIPIIQNAVPAIPGFSVPVNNSTFIYPGVYELKLIGHCGQNKCLCKLFFKADGYVCCQDYIDFSLAVTNSVHVSIDNKYCKATVNIQNLQPCAYIERVDWGDGNVDYGPWTAGSMVMHTYSGNGTFVITYLVIEKDPATGFICFEKVVSDTIKIKCKYVCCEDYNDFVQAVDAATTISIDPNLCKVTLNIDTMPCNDYLEWVNWGDSNQDYGPFTGGSMLMHTYPASGTYVITYLVIEKTPGTNLICFEKILSDTITLQCSYTCCKDYNAFVQVVDAATTISIDPSNCKVTLNIGNLPCNDYLEWVNWGDGNQIYGPFASNSMTMHTYSVSGTYIITFLVIEKNPATGFICFEKILKDTITLQCSYTCCKDYNTFVQSVDAATTITIDSNACKVKLNIGNLPCDGYLEWVNWGDSYQDYGPYPGGSMPMHTYLTSGTYIITYLAIEKDPATGFICFEKILRDTIILQCNSTGTYWNKDNVKHIYMFPNPTSGELNIEWVSELSDIDKVMIVDIAGKKVMTKDILWNVTSTQLDISAVSEGFYFLKLFTREKLIAVKKLIKN